jgi:hypothetical protein
MEYLISGQVVACAETPSGRQMTFADVSFTPQAGGKWSRFASRHRSRCSCLLFGMWCSNSVFNSRRNTPSWVPPCTKSHNTLTPGDRCPMTCRILAPAGLAQHTILDMGNTSRRAVGWPSCRSTTNAFDPGSESMSSSPSRRYVLTKPS